MSSFLVGYIEEAWPGLAAGGDGKVMERLRDAARKIERHNESVLSSLPHLDEFPPICRPMFGWAPADAHMITYRNRLIHFGASMKVVDWCIRDWMDKFENLLRQLYWESAYVRVEMGYLGTHEFFWRPPDDWVEALCLGQIDPINEWSFTGTMPQEDLDGLREK